LRAPPQGMCVPGGQVPLICLAAWFVFYKAALDFELCALQVQKQENFPTTGVSHTAPGHGPQGGKRASIAEPVPSFLVWSDPYSLGDATYNSPDCPQALGMSWTVSLATSEAQCVFLGSPVSTWAHQLTVFKLDKHTSRSCSINSFIHASEIKLKQLFYLYC
jgi:hypothetical protein